MLDHVTFLVVDDQPAIRTIVSEILRAAGSRRVLHAQDGASALEAVRQYRPDIVITDAMMDGMAGLEMVRMVRRATETSDAFLPIIMLTARTDEKFVIEARDAGVTEFVAKPISPANLLSRVNAVILRPRPFIKAQSYVGPDRRRRDDGDKSSAKRRGVDRTD